MKSDARQLHRDIARRFSSAAEGYERNATMQRNVAAKLVTLIPEVSPRTILDLGCGTGALTRSLAARWPEAKLTAVDSAEGMIAAMKRTCPQVHAYVADISCLMRNPVFDLVASSCALHWVSPFADGIARAADQLRPGGTAAFAIMLDGTLRELHEARREAAPDKAALAKMPTIQEVRSALSAVGLRLLTEEAADEALVFASPRVVLDSLRVQGLTAGHLARGSAPLTRGEFARLEKLYTDNLSVSGGVTATYRVGYFIVRKP